MIYANSFDYDPYRLKSLKPACALVRANGSAGTGFLVDGPRVRTCAHVVKDLPVGTTVKCTFGESGQAIDLRISSNDAEADVAYLLPDDHAALAAITAPRLAKPARQFMNWWAWGFPKLSGGIGVPLFGFLADPDATRDGRKCYQLFGANLLGDDAQLGGFSGSPVLAETEIVAMIHLVLNGTGDGKRARLGLIYALPIGDFPGGTGGANLAPAPSAPSGPPPPNDKATPEEVEQIEMFAKLHTATSAAEVSAVLDAWKKTAPVPPNVPLLAAERIIGMGHARTALKILDEQQESIRKTQLTALSYSLLKKHDKAQSLIKSIEDLSPESGGIWGGILKRRYFETKNRAWLEGAFDQYDRTFQWSKHPYPGINAAATALWLGDKVASCEKAVKVADLVIAKPEGERDQWDWATLGEASLLCSDLEKASTYYKKAVSADPAQARAISVMRKQARVSLKSLAKPPDLLDPMLIVGGVACFTGHRVDEVSRKSPRFPREKVADVAKRIRAIIEDKQIRFGHSSAAGGADILFIEQLLACGGSPSIFLPFPMEHFVKTSVGADWHTRFDAAIAAIPSINIHLLSDSIPDSSFAEEAAYEKCNDAIREAALEAGRIYDEEPLMIAVIGAADQGAASLPRGGTADALRHWRELLHGPIEIIDPMNP